MEAAAANSPDRLALLEDEIVQSSAVLSAATGRLLDAVREFDAQDGWAAQGSRSCAHWLSWRVGVGLVAAREQVRVARALGALPAIDAALHDGRLSYSKVRAMTRVATAENEQELLELALLSTASQLERICRGYRSVRRQLEGEDPAHHDERRVDWHWDDGMLVLQARLGAEEGELVLQALRAARDSLREEARQQPPGHDSAEARRPDEPQAHDPDGSAEAPADEHPHPGCCDPADPVPTPNPDLADALCAVAETSLAQGLKAAPGGARHQVVVHLHSGRAHLEDGPPLQLEGALRLACDAQLVPVRTDRNGRVLDVGRARRSVPPAIGRALRLRDKGCRFPGCTCRRFVDAHHVRHWARGGETKLDNLLLLCRHHHRLLHEGRFAVGLEQGRFVFRDREGRQVLDSPELAATGLAGGPAPVHRPRAGHVGRWDCGWAVGGLLELDGLLRHGKPVGAAEA